MCIGYGENHAIPNPVRERYSLNFIRLRFGEMKSPRTSTAYEICAGRRNTEQDVFAVSALVSYRRNFLVRGSTALGYDLGIGLFYFSEHVAGQATKGNFNEQAGLTLQIATSESSALTVDYRFSHVSNAKIKYPNAGINCSVASIGHTWYL